MILPPMFSGIVEATSLVLWANEIEKGKLVRVGLSRPTEFNDLKPGDSVASDGVCLTVESHDDQTIVFALAAETLAITSWRTETGPSGLVGRKVNLERSLKMGDRIHGHWVTGHVDATTKVVKIQDLPGMRIIDVEIPQSLKSMVWKKGSWALNGVSLTVNSVENGIASHCLIPETLMRTNLGDLAIGDLVNIEVDVFARALAQSVESYLKANLQEKVSGT